MELRRFTDRGVEQFRVFLHELGAGATAVAPSHVLTDPEFSKPIGGGWHLEPVRFGSRLALARYLDQTLEALPERSDKLANDVHFWSWMSLFYFDQVCPANDKGRRRPGRDYRHIPEPGYPHALGPLRRKPLPP